jgi:hypothetical protein
MSENINVVPLRQPNEVDDPLTNILRSGARQLLAQAVEMEAEAFLAAMKGLKLPDGRDRSGPWPCRTRRTEPKLENHPSGACRCRPLLAFCAQSIETTWIATIQSGRFATESRLALFDAIAEVAERSVIRCLSWPPPFI